VFFNITQDRSPSISKNTACFQAILGPVSIDKFGVSYDTIEHFVVRGINPKHTVIVDFTYS
jgi:hypothetical protein